MPKVHVDILIWARERRNFDIDTAAKKLSLSTKTLMALEAGEKDPTRKQLSNMSKSYHQPLLTFYLAEPPTVADRGEDRRMLPEIADTPEYALADIAIRNLRARQELVRATLIDAEEAEELPFIGSARVEQGVDALAQSIAGTIGFDRNQFRSQKNRGDAFAYLRECVEAAGIFVVLIDNLGNHFTTIPVETFRGFALSDKIAPFAAVNSNDAKGAWCFTLVHEIAHLWIGDTAISGPAGSDDDTERFCDDVASEFLLPRVEMKTINAALPFQDLYKELTNLSNQWKVSGTMIAYKLWRGGSINAEQFRALRNAFYQAYIESKTTESDGGGTYYNTKQHRVGKTLITLVSRMLYSGAITSTAAGTVLDVKPQNIAGLIEKIAPGGVPDTRLGTHNSLSS